MSRAEMKAAVAHGLAMPEFHSRSEAEKELFRMRDRLLADLLKTTERAGIALDFSPESLKVIESWFFRDSKLNEGPDRESIRQAINVYVGETFVRSDSSWTWTLTQFPFVPNRFQLGVARPLVTINLLPSSGWLTERNSGKRHQYLWRQYKVYAA